MRALAAASAVLGGALLFACNAILGIDDGYHRVAVDAGPTGCVSRADCNASGEICLFGVCSHTCQRDADCPAGWRCLNTDDGAACVNPSLASCTAGACPSGTTCHEGECRSECIDRNGCAGDQTCTESEVCVGTLARHDRAAPEAGAPGGAGGSGGASGTDSGGSGGHDGIPDGSADATDADTGSGGSPSSGGAPSTGGSDGGLSGSGGAPSAGGATSGGAPSSGGTSSGGASSGGASSGGASSGGASSGGAGPVNECATDNGGCDDAATCEDTPTGRTCTCPAGQVGDGTTCMCDLNGTFAMRAELDIEWDAVTSTGQTLIAAGSDTLYSWAIRRMTVTSGSTVQIQHLPCGGTAIDLCSPLFNQAFRETLPTSIWLGPLMPVSVTTTTIADPDPGEPFMTPTEATLLGATLANPLGAWPTAWDGVPTLTWADHDSDSFLGVTSMMTSTGTSPSCGNDFYANLPNPANALGTRIDRIYGAHRVLAAFSGTLTSCSAMTGALTGPSSGQPRIDGRVRGCRHAGGAACSAATVDAVDAQSSASQRVVGARFSMQRASAGITCADVQTIFPQ